MNKMQAIIAAAGEGTRLGAGRPKALVPLNDRPLIVYALEKIASVGAVDSIVLAVTPQALKEFESVVGHCGLKERCRVVAGGTTRQESVRRALAALNPGTRTVLVHDGARPLVSRALLERIVHAAQEWPAVIAAVPVKPTIKRVSPAGDIVEATLDRRRLWETQTPQVFDRGLLERAHGQPEAGDATDDAALVERLGETVRVVRGEESNIKITTPEDLVFAEIWRKTRPCSASE